MEGNEEDEYLPSVPQIGEIGQRTAISHHLRAVAEGGSNNHQYIS
jgi:hypothetical protein